MMMVEVRKNKSGKEATGGCYRRKEGVSGR